MILIDTSVIVDVLQDRINEKSDICIRALKRGIPYGFSAFTYQELLQGAANEKEYARLREYLETQVIFFIPEERRFYEKAARIFFNLRRKGVTIRGKKDVLIAVTAIENDLALLHNDRDFDAMAAHVPELKIYGTAQG
jgi:predicted nucleic acid-binding protein